MREIGHRNQGLEFEFVVRASAELELGVLERRLDLAFAINPIIQPLSHRPSLPYAKSGAAKVSER